MSSRTASGGALASTLSVLSSLSALVLLLGSARCTPVLDLGSNSADGGDATPSQCNVDDGTCRAGEGCDPDPCTHCVCDDVHHWYCSVTCDGGSSCPATRPSENEACSAANAAAPPCTYDSGCHDPDVALCANGHWELYAGGGCAPPPHCPPSAPPNGSPCTERITCTWKNACGVHFAGACNGRSWIVAEPTCMPGACPLVAPGEHTTCPSDGLKCQWNNGCGTFDYGVCTTGGWSVKSTCSSAQCPAITPAAGEACATEGSACAWVGGCEAGTHLQAKCTGGVWVFSAGCT